MYPIIVNIWSSICTVIEQHGITIWAGLYSIMFLSYFGIRTILSTWNYSKSYPFFNISSKAFNDALNDRIDIQKEVRSFIDKKIFQLISKRLFYFSPIIVHVFLLSLGLVALLTVEYFKDVSILFFLVSIIISIRYLYKTNVLFEKRDNLISKKEIEGMLLSKIENPILIVEDIYKIIENCVKKRNVTELYELNNDVYKNREFIDQILEKISNTNPNSENLLDISNSIVKELVKVQDDNLLRAVTDMYMSISIFYKRKNIQNIPSFEMFFMMLRELAQTNNIKDDFEKELFKCFRERLDMLFIVYHNDPKDKRDEKFLYYFYERLAYNICYHTTNAKKYNYAARLLYTLMFCLEQNYIYSKYYDSNLKKMYDSNLKKLYDSNLYKRGIQVFILAYQYAIYYIPKDNLDSVFKFKVNRHQTWINGVPLHKKGSVNELRETIIKSISNLIVHKEENEVEIDYFNEFIKILFEMSKNKVISSIDLYPHDDLFMGHYLYIKFFVDTFDDYVIKIFIANMSKRGRMIYFEDIRYEDYHREYEAFQWLIYEIDRHQDKIKIPKDTKIHQYIENLRNVL